MNKRAVLSRLALIVFSLLVGLALAEFIAGRFIPRHPKTYRLDPHVLYRPIPNSQKTFTRLKRNGGEAIQVEFNSEGFRGDELQEGLKHKRIVVYGDSFIEGEFSAVKDTFTGQLQKHLSQERGSSVEVVNAGVVGYGPDQIYRRMREELPSLKPDLVIVAVYSGNDYGDLLRNKMYRLDADGRLVDNAFQFSTTVCKEFKAPSRFALVRLLKKVYWKVLALRSANTKLTESEEDRARKYFPRSLKESLQEYQEYIVERDNVIKQLNYDHYDADIALEPDSPSSKYKIALMKEIVAKIRKEAETAHVRLLVLIIPSPIDVVPQYYWSVNKEQYPQYDSQRLTRTLDDIANQLQIPNFDLYVPLSKNNPGSLFFSYGDNHWNDQGQSFAASQVVEYIDQQNLLGEFRP